MKKFRDYILEAEYEGRKVELNNPFRAPKGDKKKVLCVCEERKRKCNQAGIRRSKYGNQT